MEDFNDAQYALIEYIRLITPPSGDMAGADILARMTKDLAAILEVVSKNRALSEDTQK